MSQQETVERINKERMDAAKKLKIDYENIFETTAGKRVLEDIKASGVWQRSAFNTDSHIMAANCAKQDFARHIVDMATPLPSENKLPKKAIRKIKK
jgi:hypothetical protein